MAREDDAKALVRAARQGGDSARRQLEEATYQALRKLARRRLAGERSDHTLRTTALVHEAYLRLVDQPGSDVPDRTHFLALAALAMRRVLVDHARRRRAEKRGGEPRRVTLGDDAHLEALDAEQILWVERALERLEQESPRACQALCCRIFAGMTDAETAEALGVSVPTARRDLRFAQAWLKRELGREHL